MTDSYYLRDVAASVFATDPQMMQLIRSTLWRMGCREIAYHFDIEKARTEVAGARSHLVVAEDTRDGRTSTLLTELRGGFIGRDRFVPIMAVTQHACRDSVTKLVDAGVDDILPASGLADGFQKRIESVSVSDRKFVVTADYVGPDRRKSPRQPQEIRRCSSRRRTRSA